MPVDESTLSQFRKRRRNLPRAAADLVQRTSKAGGRKGMFTSKDFADLSQVDDRRTQTSSRTVSR